MDELENPNADEAVAGAADADAPQDPVQAAKDDAWLAQFRADNAAAVVAYDGQSILDDNVARNEQSHRRDYDLNTADVLTKDAATDRVDAAGLEKKALNDAVRHDEYETQAQVDLHRAAAEETSATHLRTDAAEADVAVKRLTTDIADETKILTEDERQYKLMQEQAVAAQRIATDEAKLPHPGDPAPADPAGQAPKP